MKKTLNARTRIFLSSAVESLWATGVGGRCRTPIDLRVLIKISHNKSFNRTH